MIEVVDPESWHYKRVLEIGDANTATLGLLPYEVIRVAAAEGRVLAFVDDDDVKGYALYRKRVRTGDIALTHLCVDTGHRGSGVARALVEGIVERNPHSAGIRLSCRKDYEANMMWPRLGFQRLGEKLGRSREGHLLVIWWLPVAARSLFDDEVREEPRLVVALDTNVVLDIVEQRDFPDSLALTEDWVAEMAESAVVEQTRAELEARCVDAGRPEPVLDGFRILRPLRELWQEALNALADLPVASSGAMGDRRIVAQAAASEAAFLLSRDGDLLRKRPEITRRTGLRLMSPADFLLHLDAQEGDHRYQTRDVAASGLSVSTLSRVPAAAELTAFCHHHLRERPAGLARRLNSVVARSGRMELLIDESGSPLALAALYREGERVVVAMLRVRKSRNSYTWVRWLVYHLRMVVASEGRARIAVEDHTEQTVAQALRDEGFRLEGSTWTAVVRTDTHRPGGPLPEEFAQFRRDALSAHLIRDYERYAWPSKVFTGIVPCYMISIQPEFARVVLGYKETQARLFEFNRLAAAARDNAYYMSPRRNLKTPARILWWVSGGGTQGGVRAISWLDDTDTGNPRRLYRKYRYRGVFDEQQVIDSASELRDGRRVATAVLFSQTDVFTEPVPIDRARELYDRMDSDGFFVTTRTVDEAAVLSFYEESVGRDREQGVGRDHNEGMGRDYEQGVGRE